MLEFLRNKKILLVVAHPDDELLGLGASMHRLIQHYGVYTKVLILGEGITSRADFRDTKHWDNELAVHHANLKSAQQTIGYHEVELINFPDNRFDTIALLDIIKVVESVKNDFQPDVIFTHHGGDVNIDHQKTFEAVITACRPMTSEKVKTIITFETPSGTEWRAATDPRHFVPNMYVKIEKTDLEAKIKGMESYEYEKRAYPHPRSPQALEIQAKRYGVIIGESLAEAFCIVRTIN